MLKLFVRGKNTANSTAMIAEQRLDQIKTDLHDSCANCVVCALSGFIDCSAYICRHVPYNSSICVQVVIQHLIHSPILVPRPHSHISCLGPYSKTPFPYLMPWPLFQDPIPNVSFPGPYSKTSFQVPCSRSQLFTSVYCAIL